MNAGVSTFQIQWVIGQTVCS